MFGCTLFYSVCTYNILTSGSQVLLYKVTAWVMVRCSGTVGSGLVPSYNPVIEIIKLIPALSTRNCGFMSWLQFIVQSGIQYCTHHTVSLVYPWTWELEYNLTHPVLFVKCVTGFFNDELWLQFIVKFGMKHYTHIICLVCLFQITLFNPSYI